MSLLQPLFHAIDAPAHQTLVLEKKSLFATAAPALLGLALIAGSTLLTALLIKTPAGLGVATTAAGRADVLRALLEALAVVFPSATIFAAYLDLKISPRAYLAATAIALLIAGVVSIAVLPMMAFLALVSRAQPMVAPALLLPFIAAGAIASTNTRILRALDPRGRARSFAAISAVAFLAAFLVRAFDLI